MTDCATNEHLLWYIDRWLSDYDGASLSCELPVTRPGQQPLPGAYAARSGDSVEARVL